MHCSDGHMPGMSAPSRMPLFLVVAASTIIGIAGVDLVLPAVPLLPERLGGDTARAQLVLAAYSLGTALGLLAFGELGARIDRVRLLTLSLVLFALVSAIAATVSQLDTLVAWRFIQGALGAAPAVFAPGIVRCIFGDEHAPKAMGWLGSAESLAPALAPIAGLYLFGLGDWRLSFWVLAGTGLGCAVASHVLLRPFSGKRSFAKGSYMSLARKPLFLRYWISQSLSLASILIFVFGAPAVFVEQGFGMEAFIALQLVGVATFIAGSLLSSIIAERIGAPKLLWLGTGLLAATFGLIFLSAVSGYGSIEVILPLFALNGLGFGLRGPIGFHRAIVAADGDDGRAAALVVLLVLMAAALGTAVLAPHLALGLAPLAGFAASVSCAALAALLIGRSQER